MYRVSIGKDRDTKVYGQKQVEDQLDLGLMKPALASKQCMGMMVSAAGIRNVQGVLLKGSIFIHTSDHTLQEDQKKLAFTSKY